jgi:hypothetical protein
MNLLNALVEQRIAAAAAKGEFDHLPGSGAPLPHDDDLLIPEETRLANHILKNAGLLPPALEKQRERKALSAEAERLAHFSEGAGKEPHRAEQRRLRMRLLALDLALEQQRGAPMTAPREYRAKLAERLGGAVGPDAKETLYNPVRPELVEGRFLQKQGQRQPQPERLGVVQSFPKTRGNSSASGA